jgi:hypothetical protein
MQPRRGLHRHRLGPASGLVLGRDLLQAFPEFGVGLPDLVADFLALEARERGLGEIAPSLPEPFFQRLYISFQSVGHGPPSKVQREQLK